MSGRQSFVCQECGCRVSPGSFRARCPECDGKLGTGGARRRAE
ncbi:hypothetical protein [Halobellus salinus]|nr:hypothetical protein [Halobellus salinus]SMP19164.1 hypothetical protein SAMN06265347_10714 [Halobellus salinus]